MGNKIKSKNEECGMKWFSFVARSLRGCKIKVCFEVSFAKMESVNWSISGLYLIRGTSASVTKILSQMIYHHTVSEQVKKGNHSHINRC